MRAKLYPKMEMVKSLGNKQFASPEPLQSAVYFLLRKMQEIHSFKIHGTDSVP